jgi:hypothetical protein
MCVCVCAAQFDGETSYHHDYAPVALPPRELAAAQPEPSPSVPFTGTSSYGADYPAHPPNTRAAFRPANAPVDGGAFQGESTNKRDYAPPPSNAYARSVTEEKKKKKKKNHKKKKKKKNPPKKKKKKKIEAKKIFESCADDTLINPDSISLFPHSTLIYGDEKYGSALTSSI